MEIVAETNGKFSLDDYAADAKYSRIVAELKSEAMGIVPKLAGRTVWMVNSTAQGGGVAEMLPTLNALMRDLGLAVNWAVITSDIPEFFQVTKRLHNLIHGDGRSGMEITPEEAKIFVKVNRENAAALKKKVKPEDVLVIHDPQPLPMGQMLAQELGCVAVWRCHIGLDRENEATKYAWEFLRPFFDGYTHSVFTAPEYIPGYLGGRATIITPGLDPLSHKNRDLMVHKLVGILSNSGLVRDGQPVATPDYEEPVLQLGLGGKLVPPTDAGLLYRPIVLQVSRWDRLKGWLPLMEGFAKMKRAFFKTDGKGLDERSRKRIELSQLILAGPEAGSVSDDPEALETLQDITAKFLSFEPEIQRSISILHLPMSSRKHNAMIVNTLQRCATIVVQNSAEEGFGLTVTEAMWKQVALLGSRACGIRQQIRDGVDGHLLHDSEDTEEISSTLGTMLIKPRERFLLGRNAQRRVYDQFLVFRQVSKYLQLFRDLLHIEETQPRIDLSSLEEGH